ncbi:hypothetical protein [Dyella choica]|uniref:FkbM family methyltransferase n=1 Tax=Dyella choica TaxID=1927959 RepID=A0A432M8M2_9GAMM|nr:hypothetical protein [Dyella choica]RUL78240.1 hypothetical protein EKH80_05235 [Dyella choica]
MARSLALYGEWIEQEIDFLSDLVDAGQTILELGGQHAAHTLWLARVVGAKGAVHVTEARRLAFQHMCANVAINQLTNVYPHARWLGPSAGPMSLPISLQAQGEQGEIIHAVPLDELRLPALHLVKVNQQGALMDLLAGGIDTLRIHRPMIYFRLPGAEQAESEVRALKQLGYRCWSHVPYLYNASNHKNETRNLFPGCVSANVLASPIERGYAWPGREILMESE